MAQRGGGCAGRAERAIIPTVRSSFLDIIVVAVVRRRWADEKKWCYNVSPAELLKLTHRHREDGWYSNIAKVDAESPRPGFEHSNMVTFKYGLFLPEPSYSLFPVV
jgi:hypothetical protein